MVVKKRQEYGFYGYQIPVIPRAPRSLRRSSFKRKSLGDGQLCAFELLAAVSGKLLQESESSASSTIAEGKVQLGINEDSIKKEQVEERVARSECLDKESCIESVIVPESAAPEHNTKSAVKELPHFETNSFLEHVSVVTNSDFLNKVSGDVKSDKCTSNNAAGSFPCKSEEIFDADGHLCNEAQRKSEIVEKKKNGDLNMANFSGSKDARDYHVHSSRKLNNSEGSIKFPLCRDRVPGASFPRHRNNVKIVNRDDDDENYLNNKIKPSRPQSHTKYRRMKKLMTSRYWRTAPKLKDWEFINSGRGNRPIYNKRKTIYPYH